MYAQNYVDIYLCKKYQYSFNFRYSNCNTVCLLCCLLDVAAEGSATRAADNSVRPDLLSLSISMQQSLSAASQPRPEMRPSAPVISTAREHRIGYSAAADLPASGHSWTSHRSSGVQRPYVYTTSTHITEAASRLFGPTVVRSVAEERRPARPVEWPAAEAQDDSQLAVVHGRDNDGAETDDESSMLSLSVNRLV